MRKGYIFKDNGGWKWGYAFPLNSEEALFQMEGEFKTWDEALHDLIVSQIQES